MPSVILAEPAELVLLNTSERIDIRTRNDAGAAAATTQLSLTVMDLSDTVVHKDAFPSFTLTGTVSVTAGTPNVTGTNTKFTEELDEGDTVTIAAEARVVLDIINDTSLTLSTNHTAGAASVSATKATRIINPELGHYYIEWGNSSAPANVPDQTETSNAQDLLFVWQATVGAGTEQISVVQTVQMVPARVMRLLHPFRLLIDKSAKMVSSDPDDPCFLGYTDAMLIQFLKMGLDIINAYEPYPTWCTLDTFPVDRFGHVLYESALVAGTMSQQLFAIDTDIPNYSDQGNSFVIQHGPQLAAFLNTISQRLDKLIPLMKLKFVNSGSLHIEASPNFRLATLINAAPSGALFRNSYFASS